MGVLNSVTVQDVLIFINASGLAALGIAAFKVYKKIGGVKTPGLLNDLSGKMTMMNTKLGVIDEKLDGFNKRCEHHMEAQAREFNGVNAHLSKHDDQIFVLSKGQGG
ncbi:MAG: hypothetical protein WC455_22285 [Dehalococcoidia bacterium]|jgi:hypothetical protein